MFSTIHSSSLGKSNCGSAIGNPYTPSTTSTINVSFRPMKNTTGNMNYIALIENDNENIIIPPDMKGDNEYEDSYSDTITDNINTNTNDIFYMNNDYVKTFYIGSITVVGLYILFRILDRTK